LFHVLPALEHHTYSEDDVEGGIKIKKKIKIKNFFRAEVESLKKKKKNFIPNRHFWMLEGSLNKV
jgi:hypothetical protein